MRLRPCLAEATSRIQGGPPALIDASSRHLAAALELAGFHVVGAPADGPQLTLKHSRDARRDPPGGKRDKLLRLPIGELESWQLVASCAACRTDRILFVRELVKRCGPTATLVMLVPRLRCHVASCRRPLSHLVLRNEYPAQMDGERFVHIILR